MNTRVREQDGAWYVFCSYKGKRKAKCCGSGKAARKDADALAKLWQSHLTLGNVDEVFPKEQPKLMAAAAFPRLRDAVPAWIERKTAAGEFRGATPYSFLNRLEKWCFPFALPDGRQLGDVPVDQVSREQIGAAILAVKAAGKSKAVVDGVRFPLQGFYREMVETKALASSPAADLGYFAGKMKKGRRVDFFTEAEGRTLIDAAKALQPRWAGFIMTGLLAGLRFGEIAALRQEDVDPAKSRVRVRRSWSSKARREESPKNGRERDVYLGTFGDPLPDALKAQIETASMEKAAGRNPLGLLFPSEADKHADDGSFSAIWTALLKKARLRHRGFHCTRHSYATWALENGKDLRWVQRQLGHASVKLTADTYGHVIPERHEKPVRLEALDGC